MNNQGKGLIQEHSPKLLFWFLIASPYYLNDFLYLGPVTAPGPWILVDNLLRILSLVAAYLLYKPFGFIKDDFGFQKATWSPAVYYLVIFFLLECFIINPVVNLPFFIEFGRTIDIFFSAITKGLFNIFYIPFNYPVPDSIGLIVFDLTFSLFLVAISEEVICRSLLYRVMKGFKIPTLGIVILSALLFALFHWGRGTINLINTFLFGIMAMTLFIKTKSLYPSIILHYLVNLYFFGKLYLTLPK